MAGMPWVKIWTETLDEVKLVDLTDDQKWRFIQLILVAAECDAEGAIVTSDSPVSHKQLCWRLRCESQILEGDIEALIKVGLIHKEDGIIIVTKFAERQGPTQEEKRRQWRERQKRRRNGAAPQKELNVTQESRVTHARVTPLEEEEEEEQKKTIKAASAASAVVEPLTDGQRLLLDSLGAKRFRNKIQRDTVYLAEDIFGFDVLKQYIHWAANKGLSLGDTVGGMERALPKWGQPKNGRSLKEELIANGYIVN